VHNFGAIADQRPTIRETFADQGKRFSLSRRVRRSLHVSRRTPRIAAHHCRALCPALIPDPWSLIPGP
jgi:hypothetical protein